MSRPMDESQLCTVIDRLSRQAIGADDLTESQRAQAMEFYLGEARGELAPPDTEGRSGVVSKDLMDVVEWAMPALMAVTPEFSPATCTGLAASALEPSPSWPKLLSPQHFAAPLWMAQVWEARALMALTPPVRPATWTGALESVLAPSPS